MSAIMIDLETMDNRPTAAIASIGAVWFEPSGSWIGRTFNMHVDLVDCQRHGLTIGADTVLWWLYQSEEAIASLRNGQDCAAPLVTALDAFDAFVDFDDPEFGEVWCNGASFDFPILANAFRAAGGKAPWKFWQERDLRTLKGLSPDLRIERSGTHHNALDDALHQARLVQHILTSRNEARA